MLLRLNKERLDKPRSNHVRCNTLEQRTVSHNADSIPPLFNNLHVTQAPSKGHTSETVSNLASHDNKPLRLYLQTSSKPLGDLPGASPEGPTMV